MSALTRSVEPLSTDFREVDRSVLDPGRFLPHGRGRRFKSAPPPLTENPTAFWVLGVSGRLLVVPVPRSRGYTGHLVWGRRIEPARRLFFCICTA